MQKNEKTRWRNFWIPVMMIALIISSFPVSADDEPDDGDHIATPYVICPTCKMGYMSLVCDKKPIYDGTSTHKYNLTKNCTKTYYQATYTGYVCADCGAKSELFGYGSEPGNEKDSRHDCFVVHSSCGKGTESYCKSGQLFEPDPTPDPIPGT